MLALDVDPKHLAWVAGLGSDRGLYMRTPDMEPDLEDSLQG
jgi:hypothetical protein